MPRSSQACSREAAINHSTPNLTRVVDHASLGIAAAATSSGDATTLTTTQGTSSGQSPQSVRQSKHSKGKEPTHTATKSTSKVSEVELPKKRPLQGPHLLDSINLREVAPSTTQALALQGSQRESSSGQTPSCLRTREGFKLLESRRELENLVREIQRASPLITNLQVLNWKVGRHFGKIVLN